MADKTAVIYWDATALLSYLFRDEHSEQVINRARQKGAHLLTTLAVAEVYTVISRIQRENLLPAATIASLYAVLESGPWSRLNIVPDRESLRELSAKWPLEGFGLWHLATAKALQSEFPELMILTFDRNLARASIGEKLKLCIVVNAG